MCNRVVGGGGGWVVASNAKSARRIPQKALPDSAVLQRVVRRWFVGRVNIAVPSGRTGTENLRHHVGACVDSGWVIRGGGESA